METRLFHIRELSEKSGVSAHTLRYYERVGLLPRAERSASGYRMYPAEAVRRVRLVRILRELGFGVRELRGLTAVLGGHFPPRAVRRQLREKRDAVGERLAQLERSWKLLDVLQSCRCGGDCALVARLLDGGPSQTLPVRGPVRARRPAGAKRETRT